MEIIQIKNSLIHSIDQHPQHPQEQFMMTIYENNTNKDS